MCRDTWQPVGCSSSLTTPLIRSQEFLLQYLIGMWSTDIQCFIVRGEQADILYYRGCILLDRTPIPWEGTSC
jgi:hypothetical protein